MSKFRYILEQYKTPSNRFTCPACGHKREFTYYVDTLTGSRLPEQFGKCNRTDNCGYHLDPYREKYDPENNRNVSTMSKVSKPIKPILLEKTFIPTEVFEKSLQNYDENNLVKYLADLFGKTITQKLISKYLVGTAKKWPGATVFWQKDNVGNIRAGKVMAYQTNGRRIKESYDHIAWVHKLLNISNFNLDQCLFGLHLLQGNNMPVAVVESEKTAIISSVYFPKFIWLATGGKEQLSKSKCETIKSRNVMLWPDSNAFERWNEIAKEFGFKISDLLEKNGTDTQHVKGWDLADYLVKCDSTGLAMTDNDYPVMWDVEIETLRDTHNTPSLT